MERKVFNYETKEEWLALRSQDVTSTEVSALFGLNPYMSSFELWHRKKNNMMVDFQENERMKWGSRLEDVIAKGIAEDHNLVVKPFKSYMRIEELNAGSSFDYLAGDNEDTILEIKNVDSLQFKNKWVIEDGQVVEAPPHIELQVQAQLFVSGKNKALIGALVGGNSVSLIERKMDEKIIHAIRNKIMEFWDSINRNIPPKPNFNVDSKFISELYQNVEPGKIIEDHSNEFWKLVEGYKNASEAEKQASELKDKFKAQMLIRMGDSEKVKGDGFSVSAGLVRGGPVSYVKKDYRMFRVNLKKD